MRKGVDEIPNLSSLLVTAIIGTVCVIAVVFFILRRKKKRSSIPLCAIIGMGMQAVAAVSGQYYMHQLSAQLSGIAGKLDKLIEFHHDEKWGDLQYVEEALERLVQSSASEIDDISEVRRLREIAGRVFNEYKNRFDFADMLTN